MAREAVYALPDLDRAIDAVEHLDPFPEAKLVGVAVFAKGYEGDEERYYLYVNTEGMSDSEFENLSTVCAAFGELTDLTFRRIRDEPPEPHFVASGVSAQILAAIRAYRRAG